MGALDTWVLTTVQWSSAGSERSGDFGAVTVLRVFRIARLVRVVRLFRVFKELVMLVRTMGEALRAVFWMALLCSVVVFVGGVLCTMTMGGDPPTPAEEDPERAADRAVIYAHFGSLTQSLFSHFVLITTESWVGIATAVMEIHGAFWGFYFVCFIMVTNFCLLNMVVAVITEKILSLGQEDPPLEQLQGELEEFEHCMKGVFSLVDVDTSGNLTMTELQEIFEDPQLRRVLEAFEINCALPFDLIWPIIDVNGDGSVSFEEFIKACIRLRGSRGKQHFQTLVCHADLQRVGKRLEHEMREQREAKDVQFEQLQALLASQQALAVSQFQRFEEKLMAATFAGTGPGRQGSGGEAGPKLESTGLPAQHWARVESTLARLGCPVQAPRRVAAAPTTAQGGGHPSSSQGLHAGAEEAHGTGEGPPAKLWEDKRGGGLGDGGPQELSGAAGAPELVDGVPLGEAPD